MIPLEDTQDAGHVAIVVKSSEFMPCASALYSYMLWLHKKVSWVCVDMEMDGRFSFLPWFDKIKSSLPPSADLILEPDGGLFCLYDFFKKNGVKINKKISTALYASLLVRYDGFYSKELDGDVFTKAGELVALGADYRTCSEFLIYRTTLARLRLKSLMLGKMVLRNNAREMVFNLNEDDLGCSGATLSDAKIIIKDALGLEYVHKVTLVQNGKILKSIGKEE